jgi:N-acetylmuramoyl-L-alanine amidase
MNITRRHAIGRGGALVLSIGVHHAAHGASIVAVRVWPAADYTRVTIESDEPLAAKHFQIPDGPPRLVVDIDQLELSPTLRDIVGKVRADDPYIAGVRVGQNQPRVVRLVLDLKQNVTPQQFTLQPVAAYGHRLVFDLYPLQERDPLIELLRDKERAEQQAEKAVRDALGEMVARAERGEVAASAAKPTPARPAPKTASSPLGTPAPPPPPNAEARRKIERLLVVAIDPGHGGEDPGAVGPSGLKEKDVVLSVALKLRDRLNAIPGTRAMLTRDGDYFVPLQERVRKARRVQADLFVSVHADAFLTPKARGASVFALSSGAASTTGAGWMADRENAADVVGGVHPRTARDAQVLRAMLEMSTAAQIKDSLRVGHEVLQRIGLVGHLHKSRVEQAGFAVLKAPDIPSILVETAFISNPEEERLLRSSRYQDKLVDALAIGIRRYFARNPPRGRQRAL